MVDLDTIIIVKNEMTTEKYKSIKEIFSSICSKYSTSKTDVLYGIADGPMKPKSFKSQEIFLHCILHTQESYKNSPLLLCKNSWQQYNKSIKGKPLKSYQSFKGVTKNMLLNSALGINHLIELVSKDSSGYIGWERCKGDIMKWKMFPLKFKYDDEKTDLYIYSVLRSASNTIRFLTRDNETGINKKMAELFEKKFRKMTQRKLPLKLINEKKLLRNKLYKGDTKLLKKQTLIFLKELKINLENN